MASYAYKEMLEVLPPELVKDWEGSADYNSELWTIGSDYILKLKRERGELKKLIKEALDALIDNPDETIKEKLQKALDN